MNPQRRSKGILIAIIVIIIALVLVFSNKKEEGSVSIGALYLLTGPTATIGAHQVNSATLALEDMASLRTKITIDQQDTQYDPKRSVDAYQAAKLKGSKLYVADGSVVVGSVKDTILNDGNFIMVPGATLPSYFDGNKRSCRIALTTKTFGPAYANHLISKGYMKASTFFSDNEYGRGMFDDFKKAYEAQGGTIVASEFYPSAGAGDYRTNIAKLKTSMANTDALLISQVTNTIEPMFQQVKELGWNKPIVSDHYTINNPALKNLSLLNGVEYMDYEYSRYPTPNDSEISKTWKERYKARFGTDPVFLAAANYDSLMILAKAIDEVGSDPAEIGEYISSLKDYQGVTGTLTFNSDCEVQRNVTVRTVVDGAIVDIQ